MRAGKCALILCGFIALKTAKSLLGLISFLIPFSDMSHILLVNVSHDPRAVARWVNDLVSNSILSESILESK
jgi:hypothetical protein